MHDVFLRNKTFKRAVLILCLTAALLLAACGAVESLLPKPTPAPTALDLSSSGLTDISDLLDQTQLEKLDLRGNPISTEDFAALKAALPACDIAWSVPVGDERVDSTSESLSFAAPSEEQLTLFGFFPQLKEVRFERLTDRTVTDRLAEQYPDVRLLWDVSVNGETYASDTAALDFSEQPVDLKTLAPALSLLPDLQTVTFGDETFLKEDQLALVDALPDVLFVWNVQLLDDLTVRSDAAELDLREYKVKDAGAFADTLRLLPKLTYLDMCGCGPSNEEMAGMRAAYPGIKFVWYIRVDGWMLRTDIVGFSTGNRRRFPDGAGSYVAEKFSYSTITEEDLETLQYCDDLIALDIGHCGHVKSLDFLAKLPKLQYLDIALCDFTDISVLESQPELIYLQMMYNRVEDISPLAYCKNLRFLNIGDNKIRDCTPLYTLTKLERLWMNTVGVSEADIAAVQNALPNTTIKASQTNPEYAMSLWCKGNEGYVTVQKLYGLRAKFQ